MSALVLVLVALLPTFTRSALVSADRFRSLLRRSVLMTLLPATLFAAGLSALATPFVGILFGEEYLAADCVQCMRILA